MWESVRWESVEASVREAVKWLGQRGGHGFRGVVTLGSELSARRSAMAPSFSRVRQRMQALPLRLVLTLALPAVSTLVLLNLIAGTQVARADGCTWYRVQSGDTLSHIGSTYGVSVATLAATNHISNPDLIFVGQRLCIPNSSSDVSSGSNSTNGTNSPTNALPGPVSGPAAFITVALPYAQRAHAESGWPVSLILAQWGLEQGWKTPGYTGYNWGNVAALPGEPTVGGIQKWGSPAAFAYAKTPEDGLHYYLHVAALGYYSAVAPAAQASGPDAAARALGRSPWDAGHYTDHGDPGSSLLNLMHSYNLYQYDH